MGKRHGSARNYGDSRRPLRSREKEGNALVQGGPISISDYPIGTT